jgi:hypothetical protein
MINVVFVGGEGRSGSTVVATALATEEGMVAVGELHGVWQALKTNELCSCGHAFNDCPFWTAVGERAYEGWGRVDLNEVLRWNVALTRHRNLHRIATRRGRRRFSAEIDGYTELLAKLYEAIAAVSGCAVIIDSSKDPPYAFLLRQSPTVDLHVVHLVRDSRGVAYSWGKPRVERPEYENHPTLAGTFMNTLVPWRSAVEWSVKNVLFEIMGSLGTPRILVQYERFASTPDETVATIARAFGPTEIRSRAERAGTDAPSSRSMRGARDSIHMLGGNRVRFARRPEPITLDDAWRQLMDRRRRLVVTALSFPLLMKYGYVGPRRGSVTFR